MKGASGNNIPFPNSTTRVVAKEDNHTWSLASALSFTLYIVI